MIGGLLFGFDPNLLEPPRSKQLQGRPTPGDVQDRPEIAEIRVARASAQTRAALGTVRCMRKEQRNKLWQVDFSGGESGIYLGVGDCRGSINNVEMQRPNC